jgi:hypothetical protein
MHTCIKHKGLFKGFHGSVNCRMGFLGQIRSILKDIVAAMSVLKHSRTIFRIRAVDDEFHCLL